MTTAGTAAAPVAESAPPLSSMQAEHFSPPLVLRNHEAILKCTADLFPGAKIEVEEAGDPEFEGDEHLAVMVATTGAVDDLVAKHRQWHQRVRELAPQTASYYRLLLDIE